MVPSTYLWNIDSVSFDAAIPISNYLCGKSPTTSSSTLLSLDPPCSGLPNLFRSNPSLLKHKKTDEEPVREFLWRGICCCIGIKDFLAKQASLCKYIWEVVACKVITCEGCWNLDIWPKTPNQGIGTKDMILRILSKKTMKRREINSQQQYPPSPIPKRACFSSFTSFNKENNYGHLLENTWFYHGILGPYDVKNLGFSWHPLLAAK